MAREWANVKTDLWGDSDWRALSMGAQWLYLYLLSVPSLSYVGVADWRPNRIAGVVDGSTPAIIQMCADELTVKRFIWTDPDMEEVVIRSFLRHDGLLLNPNLWKSVKNDFGAVSSEAIRQLIALEANRLKDETPDGITTPKGKVVNPWGSPHLRTMLNTPCSAPWDTRGYTPSETPCLTGLDTPSSTGSPTTTATTTSPKGDIDTSTKSEEQSKKGTYSKPFEEFWVMGLRKESKLAAWRAWEKLRKVGMLPDLETLRSAIQTYLRNNPDRSFQKHPASWLNAGAWEDNYTPAPVASEPQEPRPKAKWEDED